MPQGNLVMKCDYCDLPANVRIWFNAGSHLVAINDHTEHFACMRCSYEIFMCQEAMDDEDGVYWELID